MPYNPDLPAQTSSFKKYKFATILNLMSVLKLFQLSNDDLLFS